MNKSLIIFEMANNHMGDMDHAIDMIHTYADIMDMFKDRFDFAWKFQFRHLDSFIHNSQKNNTSHPYIRRFIETNLTHDQFTKLKNAATSRGFISVCTGFDEYSIDNIFSLDFNIIKVASCSFTDWPLLNKIIDKNININKPIIMSTAGSSIEEIDRVVSFMTNRNQKLSLMHCVGEYPTPYNHLELNQINLLKNRYPSVNIGYSTHEDPNETDSVMIAIGKGVSVIEKHVALPHKLYSINKYSTNPQQMINWLKAAEKALDICGIETNRHNISEKEKADLLQFSRGVFLNKDIKAGQVINKEDIIIAWPTETNQLLASDLSKYNLITAVNDITHNVPIIKSDICISNSREKIYDIVQNIKKFLDSSHILLSNTGRKDLEISHHYGIDKFYETGLTMLTMINRSYCKKLLILLPNQQHPEQYHEIKEETFIVTFGELELTLDGITKIMQAGDTITILPEVKHKFFSPTGCIIEEISTRHDPCDSYYVDDEINHNKNRKTVVRYWL